MSLMLIDPWSYAFGHSVPFVRVSLYQEISDNVSLIHPLVEYLLGRWHVRAYGVRSEV